MQRSRERKQHLFFYCALASFIVSSSVLAAPDPCASTVPCGGALGTDNACDIGPASSGKVCVGISITAGFRIWGLSNLVFAETASGDTPPASVNETFCVFSSAENGAYRITVTSGASTVKAGALSLDAATPPSGGTKPTSIPYSISFSETGSTASKKTVSNYSDTVTLTGSASAPTDAACTQKTGNVTVSAKIPQVPVVPASDYSDVLVLTVGPGT